MDFVSSVLKVLLDWFLRPELAAVAVLVAGLAALAKWSKVPVFTAAWARFVEAFESVWAEAVQNPHVYLILGIAFLIDPKMAVIGSMAYVVVRAVVDWLEHRP